MLIDLSNLTLIPLLLEKIENLQMQLNDICSASPSIDLSTLSSVSKYLNVSKPTIYNMINDGRFKQNIHFIKQIKKDSVKIVFIESAIIKYKKEFV